MAETTNESEYGPKQMLDEVNKAITAVAAGGQSYKIGSRQLTRANLTELKNLRADLSSQLAQESNGNLIGNTYVANFEGR